MNSAHPPEEEASAPGTGAAIVVGKLPARMETVRAEVLAQMLTGQRLTSLDGVFDASTTRLAAHVHALQRDYGWHIDRADRAVRCVDGRTATVSEYWIKPESITAAGGGAQIWAAEVLAIHREARKTCRRDGAAAS